MSIADDHDPPQPKSLAELRDRPLSAQHASLRSAGFRLLLDSGRPVSMEKWAAAAGVDLEGLVGILEEPEVRGRIEIDEAGELAGIAGLTVRPTRHELTVDGVTRWTWCALDAVGILGALEATGAVHSTDPGTGEPVVIHFERGRPDGDATVFILGGSVGANVRESWCPHVNFFATRDAAEEWVAAEQRDGDIVSAADLVTDAAEMWRPVVGAASRRTD